MFVLVFILISCTVKMKQNYVLFLLIFHNFYSAVYIIIILKYLFNYDFEVIIIIVAKMESCLMYKLLCMIMKKKIIRKFWHSKLFQTVDLMPSVCFTVVNVG